MDFVRCDDIESAVDILKQCLGSSYVTEESIREDIVLVAKEGDRVVGVAVGHPMGEDDIYPVSLPKSTGIIKSLAVLPEYRKRGVGTSLGRMMEKELGCDAFFAIAWDSPEDNALATCYNEVKRVPLFWHDDEHDCPLCGVPCNCTAVFLLKEM